MPAMSRLNVYKQVYIVFIDVHYKVELWQKSKGNQPVFNTQVLFGVSLILPITESSIICSYKNKH